MWKFPDLHYYIRNMDSQSSTAIAQILCTNPTRTRRGYYESLPPAGECVSSTSDHLRTRTELLRKRRVELQSLAHELGRVAQAGRDGITPWFGKDVGWWTLADGYKENALETLASSPRYQRYSNKRARARVAEGPDPYNTHEVRIKRPSKSLAENISSSKTPPKDAEAYFTPRRTIKHFTDDFFAWEARLESSRDLDKHGKSRWFDLDEREIPYSSLDSNTTKYSLDPKVCGIQSGGQRHRAHEVEANLRASHPPGRPSASEVARRALEQRQARREALKAVSSLCQVGNKDEPASGSLASRDRRVRSPSSVSSDACAPYSNIGAELGEASRRWAFPVRRESKGRRYSRLCGQG